MYKRFTGTMKLCDVLHSNYHLLPIIYRFNIQLGIGDKSISEICNQKNIDSEFFIELLNVYNDEFYFPVTYLQRSDVRLIVEYLRKTHSYYTEYLLPVIEKLVHLLVKHGGRKNVGIKMVGNLFDDYKDEFLKHITKEEKTIFPYALHIAKYYRNQNRMQSRSYKQLGPIKSFKSEHSKMDEKLFDLKNILIKYIEPPYDVHICHTIIFELYRLERDVQDHSRIEDRILFAVIEQMESELKIRKL